MTQVQKTRHALRFIGVYWVGQLVNIIITFIVAWAMFHNYEIEGGSGEENPWALTFYFCFRAHVFSRCRCVVPPYVSSVLSISSERWRCLSQWLGIVSLQFLSLEISEFLCRSTQSKHAVGFSPTLNLCPLLAVSACSCTTRNVVELLLGVVVPGCHGVYPLCVVYVG